MGVKQRIKALQKAWNQPVTIDEAKAVINSSLLIGEGDRGGRHKGFIPNYLWKPPYGYPRYQNINEIRAFARTPHVWMAVDTISSEVSQMEWDIRVKPEVLEDLPKEEADRVQASYSERRRHAISFFRNPNTNKEPLQDILYKVTTDMLEINAGVINKIFDLRSMGGGEPRMVEIVTRDGGTFLKNPDMHGMLTTRADIVPTPVLYENNNGQAMNEGTGSQPIPRNGYSNLNQEQTAANAAYFQYGYNIAMRAVPYGKRELIWMEKAPRTDSLYGPAPVEIALTIVKVLLYGTEDMLQYYVDNNVPKGVFSLKGANQEQMDAFKEQWFNQQHTVNNLNQQMKKYWQMPFTNKEMEFVRFQFSPAELELINQQEWLSKLVWALCKVTPSELGFTENSNRATEKGQDTVHKRKALDPILSKIEYHFNTELMYEFGPDYQDLEFYFPEHDLEKERAVTEIHSMQIKNGIRTPNEVRQEMGLETVEWGDEPPSNYNSSVEDDLTRALNEPERADAIKASIATFVSKKSHNSTSSLNDQKALDTSSVLILDEGESIPEEEEEVESIIGDMLSRIEKQALEVYKEMRGETTRRSPRELKSLGDRIKESLKQAAAIGAIENTIKAAIRKNFLEGFEDIEKRMNRNFQPDKKAMSFLENYTFDNVKGLAEDSVTKLRGVLERGLIDGKGSDSIARDIQKALDIERPRAAAIARTELTRARNAGVETTIKRNGVKGKFRWKASGNRNSPRATALCTHLDGQEVDVGEDFEGSAGKLSFKGPRPPAHVNCRSRIEFIPDFEE